MSEAICIAPDAVPEIWPKIAHGVCLAMKRGGLGSFQVVEKAILTGEHQLWLVVDGTLLQGVCITSLESTEWDKTCVIVACAGKDAPLWVDCIRTIEAFARKEGCQSVRIFGRKGWSRLLPDYKETRVILEKELSCGR